MRERLNTRRERDGKYFYGQNVRGEKGETDR